MCGCGEQEAGVASGSGWNLWVWLLGVVVRRYIDFLILLIPYSSCIYLFFLPQHPSCFSFFIIIYNSEASLVPQTPIRAHADRGSGNINCVQQVVLNSRMWCDQSDCLVCNQHYVMH